MSDASLGDNLRADRDLAFCMVITPISMAKVVGGEKLSVARRAL